MMSVTRTPEGRLQLGTAVFGTARADIQHVGASWRLLVPCPVLANASTEALHGSSSSTSLRQSGRFTLAGAPPFVVGAGILSSFKKDPAAATRDFYGELFTACSGLHLCRIWNYIPAINETPQGLENYRAFCLGRAQAFEDRFSPANAPQHMPASSAVGCAGEDLILYFVATTNPLTHFENPTQIPAWQYPAEYGPRPPSFARATCVTSPDERRIYLAGTSSIRGHENVGTGNLLAQLDCTQDNLRSLSKVLGLGDSFQTPEATMRYWKIYLRHPNDRAKIEPLLDRALLRPTDTIIWLQADICRAALNIEIEAAFYLPGSNP